MRWNFNSAFVSFAFDSISWIRVLREYEILHQLFRYLEKAYLEMKGRIRYPMLPNVFCQWSFLCARSDNSIQSAVRTNGKRPRWKSDFLSMFLFPRSHRLFGLDVDMEPEIARGKRWVICENCLEEKYLRSTGNNREIFRLHGCIFMSIDKKVV